MMKQTAEEKREDIFLHRPGFGKRDYQTATKQKNSGKTSQLDMESMVLSGSQLSGLRVMLLFVIPIAMILTAIFGGYTAYRINMLNDIRIHYRALCIIPYGPLGNTTETHIYTDKDFSSLFNDKNIEDFNVKVDHTVFREEIEMDVSDDESYASIEVPSFNRIRRARFLHDFKANQSAIIDPISNRCFVMPLDRETVMTPKNFVNLITKAGSNFLNTNVNRIQRTVIVLTPYLTDLLTISKFVGDECDDMIIYKTEVYAAGDFRKKIELKSPVTYAEYLGISIIEFNVVNMDYIEEYEHLLWH
uniref:Integral membrane protein 2 n=1 Tax=Glossina pallidipes TaxID=7398 RepID=A0A1B0A235_GLOPL